MVSAAIGGWILLASRDGGEGNGGEGGNYLLEEEDGHNEKEGSYQESPYLLSGSISIDEVGSFDFEPWEVNTTRPDIFANGHYSLFDILVHLDDAGSIDLEYHFDEDMNTYVIDSLNGIGNWWYRAYYSGGWKESNTWRMDHFPYKDETTIIVYKESGSMMERIYNSYTVQVQRRADNDGKVIIPRVMIEAPSGTLVFSDVEVVAHNLRNDSFQEGVITAIDVIMSLGDLGLITYELKWYEAIGSANIVLNYWVEAINSDVAHGTCGFVYEAGEEEMGGYNHIHIPSDQRVLTSPEYVLFYWICL